MPIVPSVNHCYTNNRFGQRTLTKKGREWKENTQRIAREEVIRQGWPFFVGDWDKKLILEITAFYPNKLRRDMSNMHKLLPDSLEKIVFNDDRWLLTRDINFFVDRANPRVEVVLYPHKEKESIA